MQCALLRSVVTLYLFMYFPELSGEWRQANYFLRQEKANNSFLFSYSLLISIREWRREERRGMTRQLRHTVTTSYVTDGRFFFSFFIFIRPPCGVTCSRFSRLRVSIFILSLPVFVLLFGACAKFKLSTLVFLVSVCWNEKRTQQLLCVTRNQQQPPKRDFEWSVPLNKQTISILFSLSLSTHFDPFGVFSFSLLFRFSLGYL